MLVSRAKIHKMDVRIANREDPDQTASSDLGLHCLSDMLLKGYPLEVKNRDENSQPFSIRKICRLTPKWRKAILKSLIKGLKSQNIKRNQSVYVQLIYKIEFNFI